MAEKRRRIRIEASGLDPMNQRVVDAETGEPIDSVISVDIKLRPGEIPQAQLVIQDFDVDIQAEGDVTVEPELGAPL